MGCAALLLENGRMVACGLDESYVAYELLDKGISIDDVIVVGMSPSLVRHVEETGQRPDDVSLDGGIACLPGEEENPQWWLLTRGRPPGSSRIYGAGFRSDVDRVRHGATATSRTRCRCATSGCCSAWTKHRAGSSTACL